MNVQYKMVNAPELAEMIVNAEFGKKFNFTFDRLEDLENKKPTGWYGVTRIKIFDETEGWLIFGDYGACGLPAYDIEAESSYHTRKGFIVEKLNEFFRDEGCTDTVCLEMNDVAIESFVTDKLTITIQKTQARIHKLEHILPINRMVNLV